MTQIAIRQSGGANIISLPKALLHTLGLGVGSALEVSISNNSIVLTPVTRRPTLEELLEGSPKAHLAVREEDKEWIAAKPVGKEIG
jgi:antitoxin ChpS